MLAVPLLREERVIGALVVRREAGEFPQAVVALLQTFAAQSVLAIQNARLFQEIQEKSKSSRPRASTSRSSSPTCRTSCARPSTPSSG